MMLRVGHETNTDHTVEYIIVSSRVGLEAATVSKEEMTRAESKHRIAIV